MQNIRQMTAAELRQVVQTIATGLAAEHYMRQHHVDHDAPAWAWAADHWAQFRDRAIDVLAAIAADQEAAAAAPRN